MRAAGRRRGGWALLGSQLHPRGPWDQAEKQGVGCWEGTGIRSVGCNAALRGAYKRLRV